LGDAKNLNLTKQTGKYPQNHSTTKILVAVWVRRIKYICAPYVLPILLSMLSACEWNKQYIAAANIQRTLNKNCVDIYEFLPNNNGIDIKNKTKL
jgi:hypothetical protein